MVLILSQESDLSTNDIMDWLFYQGCNTVRINDSDILNCTTLSIPQNKCLLEVIGKDIEFNLQDVKSYWYRRGELNLSNYLKKVVLKNGNVELNVKRWLSEELLTVSDYLYYRLNNKPCIGNIHLSSANKLISLARAKEAGFNIPNSFITGSKKDLIIFQKTHKKIVTKGIQEAFYAEIDNKIYFSYTEIIDESDIEELEETFFPSFFQEEIQKKYELRVFYLKGKCYSMAIFSQNDPQTRVDFKKYNDLNPNRTVPFNLPHKIEKKIDSFMKEEKLDTGSLDLIYSTSNEYYFLEVNPIGQFGMVSYPCNYYIERLIAKELTQHETRKRFFS